MRLPSRAHGGPLPRGAGEQPGGLRVGAGGPGRGGDAPAQPDGGQWAPPPLTATDRPDPPSQRHGTPDQ